MMLLPSSKLLTLMLLLPMAYYGSCVAAKEIYKQKTTYIVHMDHTTMPESFGDHSQWYTSSLSSVSDSTNMLYSYNEVIHGYSARLTPEQATSLKGQHGVISVLKETRYDLQTTRTPQFLGIDSSEMFLISSQKANNVIIGVLDTGVWPESKSYDDTGLGPVPSTWKGTCEMGINFNSSSCNKKLIGARYFSKGNEAANGPINPLKESKSPRDDNGHGTHTSTIAAGSPVEKVSLFGYAKGTAKGIAPHSRIAAYKVCWKSGCLSSDIIAGMDMAVQDGVDIMSISLGGGSSDYYQDIIAIGAFGAMMKGIFVSASAGNSGPSNILLSNVAPWIATIGAGTIDRDFPVHIRLGNGSNLTGVSLYSGKPLPKDLVPIVYAVNVSIPLSEDGNLCINGSLIPSKVAGKIVICDRGNNDRTQKGLIVKKAGGVGMILANTNSNSDRVSDAHLIPTAAVDKYTGDAIKEYVSSNSNPKATISSAKTKLNIKPSPMVVGFSCRGPNLISPSILKPDLIAPGFNILAGWTGNIGPSELPEDTRRVSYNIISGTSMSCPHISGIAALIKGAHPDWSPSAIKSALMTTAYITKNGEPVKDSTTGQAANAFDYGAGHVNPIAAFEPGLIYDITIDDYLSFLCASNYTTEQIQTVTKQKYTCDVTKTYNLGDLNYPSFAVTLTTSTQGGTLFTVKYTRTLTNVGNPGTYKVFVTSEAPEVKIKVEPESLTFTKPNEKKSYTVTFTALSTPVFPFKYARLVWSNDKYIVASPIGFNWD